MNKTAASKQSICAVGEKLFALHGYSAVGIKLILDEVGIPKGSFYHYFASKEAFAVAVVEQYFSQRILLTAIDPSVNFKANLSIVLNGYHQLLDELFSGDAPRGCLMGNLLVEVGSQSPLLQQTLTHLYQQWLNLLSEFIQQGQQQGHIRADLSAPILASVFWSNWQGTMLRCKIKVDKLAAKRALVQCIQMMTR